jgi:hypothetical protein
MGRGRSSGGTGIEIERGVDREPDEVGNFVRSILKFPLGKVETTPDAARILSSDEIREAIARHGRGDWGKVDAATRFENEGGLCCSRLAICSLYRSAEGMPFWVMTEPERRRTLVMLGTIEESGSYS